MLYITGRKALQICKAERKRENTESLLAKRDKSFIYLPILNDIVSVRIKYHRSQRIFTICELPSYFGRYHVADVICQHTMEFTNSEDTLRPMLFNPNRNR